MPFSSIGSEYSMSGAPSGVVSFLAVVPLMVVRRVTDRPRSVVSAVRPRGRQSRSYRASNWRVTRLTGAPTRPLLEIVQPSLDSTTCTCSFPTGREATKIIKVEVGAVGVRAWLLGEHD